MSFIATQVELSIDWANLSFTSRGRYLSHCVLFGWSRDFALLALRSATSYQGPARSMSAAREAWVFSEFWLVARLPFVGSAVRLRAIHAYSSQFNLLRTLDFSNPGYWSPHHPPRLCVFRSKRLSGFRQDIGKSSDNRASNLAAAPISFPSAAADGTTPYGWMA